MIDKPGNRNDVAQRGQALYEASIRSRVEPIHNGQFVVIDVESGEFEVDADKVKALDRLVARRADAVPYLVRAGHPTAMTLRAFRFETSR